MADTVSRKALMGHTLHTPTGFLVFNAGKVTKDIPRNLVARLERDGVIEKAATTSTSTKRSSSRKSTRKASSSAKKTPTPTPTPTPTGAGTGAPPAE